MAEQHPSEITLLSYVEDDLTPDNRQDVAEHLVACRACADNVRLLEAGRTALRSAPPLQLSDERRARMHAALPDRHPRRTLSDYVRRGLLIAAPVAVAAGLAAVVFTTDPQFGGGDDDDAAENAAVDAGQAEGGGDAEMEQSTGAADATAAGTLVRNVAGPASAVVNALAAEGIEAEINEVDGSVTAQGTAADVRAALEGRPSGIVAVYVR
jgi:anti-sigma factor RsiW